MKKYFNLLLSIVVCQLAGILGSIFTASQITLWYSYLNKPSFQPPNWIFGPVWITLYTLMGIALYLIWQKPKSSDRQTALWLFAGQLFLNAIWTPIFFGWHRLDVALVVIILLWVMILTTIVKFFRLSRVSAYLLVPYLLWVSFATVLNYAILILN